MNSIFTKCCALMLACMPGLLCMRLVNAQGGLGELLPPSIPRAIERGLSPDGNLDEELQSIRDEPISTLRQAKALVQLLKALPLARKPAELEDVLSAAPPNDKAHSVSLRTLLEHVREYAPAYTHVKSNGLPEVLRIYDRLLSEYQASPEEYGDDRLNRTVMQWLATLAEYRSSEGTDRVIDALKLQLASKSYSWHNILASYTYDHPEAKRLYEFLSENLPDGPLGHSVLSAVNMRVAAENTFDHIFDSQSGFELLKKWLQTPDAGQELNVIEAIRHLQPARQTELYAIVDKHPNVDVRLASASAKARDDEPSGIVQLAELCLESRVSLQAQEVLKELDKQNQIPAEAFRRPFALEAAIYHEAVTSISYEYEDTPLGEDVTVSDIEVVEELKLAAAPGQEAIKATMVRFKLLVDDPLTQPLPGVAMMGRESTVCYLDQFEAFLSREDLISVYFANERSVVSGVVDYIDSDEVTKFRDQWTGPEWSIIGLPMQCTFDEEADYPQAQIIFTRAEMNEDSGIMVLDGPRSHFYPSRQFHPDTSIFNIRELHCGRVARQLPIDIERPDFDTQYDAQSQEKIVQVYESWLAELASGSMAKRKELLAPESAFRYHMAEYITAAPSVKQIDQDEFVLSIVEQLSTAQQQLMRDDPGYELDVDLYDGLLHDYARSPKLEPAAAREKFELWKSQMGWPYRAESLARLAMRAGLTDQAQKILEEHLIFDGRLSEEVLDCLAELFIGKGEIDKAAKLYVYGYKKLVQRATKVDLEVYDWLKEDAEAQLTKMRERLPSHYEAALEQAGLAGDFVEVVKNYRKAKRKGI